MSSINGYGGGPGGIHSLQSTQSTSGTSKPDGGGRTGALAETVRSTVLQGGPAGLQAIPTGRFSDFSITQGTAGRTPPTAEPPNSPLASFLHTAGQQLENRPLSSLLTTK